MELVSTINEADVKSFPVYAALEKAVNVDLEIIQVNAGEYVDKQNVTLASGDIPDIMQIESGEDAAKFGDEGAFVNLFDHRAQLPNFFSYYSKYEGSMKALLSSSTGKLYGFPQIYDFPYVGIGWMVRDDVITGLGYDRNNIKTLEQFDGLLYAMKKAYPDSKPYIGRWGMGWSTTGLMMDAGTGTGIYYDLNEKVYKFGPYTPELRTVVEYYAKWAKDGIFETDYNLSSEWNERLTTGKAFVVWDYVNQNDTLNIVGKTENPNYDMRGMRGLSLDGRPAGKINSLDVVVTGRVWCVYQGTRELDAALRLADYLYSAEGITLTNWGIEGLTYQTVNGKKEFTNYVQTVHNPNGQHPYAMDVLLGCNAHPRLALVFPLDVFAAMELDASGEEAMAITAEQGVSPSAYPVLDWSDAEREQRVNIMNPVSTHVNEQIALFISGGRPLSQWNAFINECKAFGVDEILNLYNSKL
jgi:putative aldouronate transport system substrate-binding protein